MQDTQQANPFIPAKQENIVSGPTKFELTLALFDHTMSNGRTVTFTTRDEAIKVAINEVGRESGDGESWLFKGYVPGGAKSVEGYYSTRTNTGWLKRSTR